MCHLSALSIGEQAIIRATLKTLACIESSNSSTVKSTDWFQWKFGASPFGEAVVAIATTDQGQVAGVVAFGLYALTQGERDITAALSYETFIHPDFRRQGLFTKLIHFGVQACHERGAKVMFNFPNRKSLPGFRKKGWIPVNCLRSFLKPVNWKNCLVNFTPQLRRAAFVPDCIESFDEADYDGFAECLDRIQSIRSETAWAAMRTPAYMLWRYKTYPLFRYAVVRSGVGWAIVRTGYRGRYREAQILELFPAQGFSRSFMKVICGQIAAKLRPDVIALTLSRAHPAYPFLWLSGFLPAPNQANFTYYPLDEQMKAENRDWILTATEFHTY
jgi:hypothetical protein